VGEEVYRDVDALFVLMAGRRGTGRGMYIRRCGFAFALFFFCFSF
jgi:hypothetical protein